MYYIYGTEGCKYCTYAREFLESNEEEYTYQDVTMDQGLMDIFKMNGFRTVPQIFKGNVHIGGFSELVEMVEEE